MTSLLGQAPPRDDADPFAPEVLRDPWPLQAALRDTGPVVHLTRYDVYVVARYDEVHAVLTNWQDFESGAGVGLSNFRKERPWRPPSLLLETDPPHHDAPRRILTSILRPTVLRQLRDRWSTIAEHMVDEALRREYFDAVPTLAEGFPLRVFPDAVGIGEDDRENLLPYGAFALNSFGPRNDLVTSAAQDMPRLSQWISERCARDALSPDGFGAEIWAAADRGEITHDQAPLIVRSLLTAGVDTTVQALAAVLYALATHPQQWQRLRAEPHLVRVAFDEAIRWQSPVQNFSRTATTDTRIDQISIPRGQKILILLGSANRDPRRWQRPDTFDLGRDPSGHVGFGMGLHQCVGQHLARLEAEALLTALANKVTHIELVGENDRLLNNTLRGWRSLPVRLR